jgi:hypothetical protein
VAHIYKSSKIFFMAKHKKKKVSGTPRRRRHKVGAIKPGSVEHFILLGVGAVAGGVAGAYGVQAANTALASTAASTPWLPPALVMGLGAGVVVVGKGNAIAEGLGLGMAAVSGVMVANQTFLNVPGISGMGFSSNAPMGTQVIRKTVGQAPGPYINQTVGNAPMKKMRHAVGALASN